MRLIQWQPRQIQQLATVLQLPLRTFPDRTWGGAITLPLVSSAMAIPLTSALIVDSFVSRCWEIASQVDELG